MNGSADRVPGHSRLPRSVRGSPGAAIAGPASRRIAAVRATFIEHLRITVRQTRCQRLYSRAVALGAPATPGLQSPGKLGLDTPIRGSVVASTTQRVGQ